MPASPIPLCIPWFVWRVVFLIIQTHYFMVVVNSSLSFQISMQNQILLTFKIKESPRFLSTTILSSFFLPLLSLIFLLPPLYNVQYTAAVLLHSLPTDATLHNPSITTVTFISVLQFLSTFRSHFQGTIFFPLICPFPGLSLLYMQWLQAAPFVHNPNHCFL